MVPEPESEADGVFEVFDKVFTGSERSPIPLEYPDNNCLRLRLLFYRVFYGACSQASRESHVCAAKSVPLD